MYTLAGELGESVINKSDEDRNLGAQSDFELAAGIAKFLTNGDEDAAMALAEECRTEVSQLLDTNMPALGAIANCLLAHLNEEVQGAVLTNAFHDALADRTCPTFPDKARHRTYDDAYEHHKSLLAGNEARGQQTRSAQLTPYFCSGCFGYHVGHKP